MKHFRRCPLILLLLPLTGDLLHGCASPTAQAQSRTSLQPPLNTPCKVILRQGVSNWTKTVSIGSITSFDGKLKASDGNWLVMSFDKPRPELWIPRDQVALIVYDSPEALRAK